MTVMSTMNRTVIPAAINGLGAVEVAARGLTDADLSTLVRRKPVATIGLTLIAGLLFGQILHHRKGFLGTTNKTGI